MIVANVVGTAIPLVLSRLGIDPAVATGPLVTTSVDILGTVTYFSIAALLGAFLPSPV
jgi:magnesium transporter